VADVTVSPLAVADTALVTITLIGAGELDSPVVGSVTAKVTEYVPAAPYWWVTLCPYAGVVESLKVHVYVSVD
jgi:hypothetical protein